MKYQNITIGLLIFCLKITVVICIEIKKLLEKKDIKVSRPVVNEFISGLFTRDKKIVIKE